MVTIVTKGGDTSKRPKEVRFWCAFTLAEICETDPLPALAQLAAKDRRTVRGSWAVSRRQPKRSALSNRSGERIALTVVRGAQVMPHPRSRIRIKRPATMLSALDWASHWVYLCTSDQSAETGGERPHKMKSPQTPFRTT
jgi:hypothetical protein